MWLLKHAAIIIVPLCLGACADDREQYRVGIGGQYFGNAQCVSAVADDGLLHCDVRRTSGNRDLVLTGLYRRSSGEAISQVLTIGVGSYTPVFTMEAPATDSAAAVEICRAINEYGEADATCTTEPPRAGEAAVLRLELSAFPECDLLARLAEGLLRVTLRSNCPDDPWERVHSNLVANFENLEAAHLRRL